jgi:hypothetical protein
MIEKLESGQARCTCEECKSVIILNSYRKDHINKFYLCAKCRNKGEKNPFYGKKHSDELKNKFSKERKGICSVGEKNPMFKRSVYSVWLQKYGKDEADKRLLSFKNNMSIATSGEKNPFYGKKHSDLIIKQILKSRKITINTRSDDRKKEVSNNIRLSQEKLKITDPLYFEKKARGGRAAMSKSSSYKINNLEKKVEQWLKNNKIDYKYSVIMSDKNGNTYQ